MQYFIKTFEFYRELVSSLDDSRNQNCASDTLDSEHIDSGADGLLSEIYSQLMDAIIALISRLEFLLDRLLNVRKGSASQTNSASLHSIPNVKAEPMEIADESVPPTELVQRLVLELSNLIMCLCSRDRPAAHSEFLLSKLFHGYRTLLHNLCNLSPELLKRIVTTDFLSAHLDFLLQLEGIDFAIHS